MSKIGLNKVILFDADCIFCNRILRFVLHSSIDKKIHASPLKSGFSARLFTKLNIAVNYDSVYYYKNGQIHSKANALREILSDMNKVGKFIFYLIKPFPDTFINFIYSIVAKNRYHIITNNSCSFNPVIEKQIIR